MANEIYDSTWWGNTIDTASSIGTSTEMIQGQFNMLTSNQPNLVTNGDFSNGSTDWILDSGWSVSDNKALCDGTNLAYITQTAVLTTGKSYKVQFDIVYYTSGSVKYRDNGFVSGQSFSGVGSYTDYVVAGGGKFRLMSENFTGSIDNVSVKEVRATTVEASKCLADAIHRIGIQDIQN